jgi:hypothetical protein
MKNNGHDKPPRNDRRGTLSQFRPIFLNEFLHSVLSKRNTHKKCRKPGGNGPLEKGENSQGYDNDIDLTEIKYDVMDRIHLAHDSIQCISAVNATNYGLHDRLHC